MNKDNAKDYLPLVKAMAEGKAIQVKTADGEWKTYAEFEFCLCPEFYRVKPAPVKRYIATYFDGDRVYVSKPVKNRADLEAVVCMYPTFKIHELDCGEAP